MDESPGARGFAGRAPGALVLSAGLVGAVLAWGRAPASWEASFRGVIERPADGLPWGVPLLEVAVRADVLVLVAVAVVAVASCGAAYGLFGDRGPGRWFAVLTAGPLAAIALLPHAWEITSAAALRVLPGIVLGLVAIATLARGRRQAGARVRALGVAAMACAWDLGSAWPWLVITLAGVIALERGSARASDGSPVARSDADDGSRISTYVLGLAPAIALFVGLRVALVPWPRLPSGALGLDATAWLAAPWPPVVVFAGTALLVTRAVLDRDAMAGLGLAIVVVGTTVRVGTEPLLASASVLVLLAIAAADWCARASAWWPSPRGTVVIASLACLGVLVPAARALPRARPLALVRPDRPALSFYAKGLIAPRDAVLVFGPWFAWLEQQRTLEGFRPDVAIVHAPTLGESALLRRIVAWDEEDRRVLSDSFDAGGRWDPELVADSGPLFWLVGRPVPHGDEFTDLSHLEPPLADLPADERDRWAALQIERARYRRARGAPAEALEALPLPFERKASLRTRLRLSRRVGPEPSAASELHRLTPDVPAEARVAAEAGDLLYAYGEPRRGTELLLEAFEAGDTEALAALVRWQVRAGQATEAEATLQSLVTSDRALAIELLHWLVDRDRMHEAMRLLGQLEATAPPGALAPDEIAARLRVLAREATFAPVTPPDDDTPSVTAKRRSGP